MQHIEVGEIHHQAIDDRDHFLKLGVRHRIQPASRSGLQAESLTKPLLLLNGCDRERFVDRARRDALFFFNIIIRDGSPGWQPGQWPHTLTPLSAVSV
jgi:hypothetical protein